MSFTTPQSISKHSSWSGWSAVTPTSSQHLKPVIPVYSVDEKGYMNCSPGLILANRYTVCKKLGKGTFSRVFECDRLNGGKVAVKVIRNQPKYQVAARIELAVLQRIAHFDQAGRYPVIQLLEYSEWLGHPLLAFPLMGQSVHSFMASHHHKPFSYDDAIDMLRQICRGVSYIHSLGLVVTDLKPENIVFVDDSTYHQRPSRFLAPRSTQIRIIDLGSAVLSKPTNRGLIQTRHFRAPEVILNMNWDYAADIWSIGCIAVELVSGRLLFDTHCDIDQLNQISKCIGPLPSLLRGMGATTWFNTFDHKGQLRMDRARVSKKQCVPLHAYFPSSCPSDQKGRLLHDLTSRMLCWEPKQRITASDALRHPVFHGRV